MRKQVMALAGRCPTALDHASLTLEAVGLKCGRTTASPGGLNVQFFLISTPGALNNVLCSASQ
jgi:hypothetical protein